MPKARLIYRRPQQRLHSMDWVLPILVIVLASLYLLMSFRLAGPEVRTVILS